MNNFIKHKQEISENIINSFEKAHVHGEVHPNGKWYWNSQVNNGKGDWRVIKKQTKKEVTEPLQKVIKKWDAITGKYRDVLVDDKYYTTLDGEKLLRIETKGKTGKKLYSNDSYLDNGKESPVFGMGGSTGHGWGGKIVGYATELEISSILKIK